MPRELKFHPNERVDLDDIRYGTSTFPVDLLRENISRILSGDYNGGFILEGFRVSIFGGDPLKLTVEVHNGVALDKSGRLITYESGEDFLSNDDLTQVVSLTSGDKTYYISIEFILEDDSLDQRSFWDPTYENPKIEDSAKDLVPVPSGKEFTFDVPTRLAKKFNIVVSTHGFDDLEDLNTERIPVAIIPVLNDAIAIPDQFVEVPTTTVMKKVSSGDKKIICGNTRIFRESDTIKILDFKDGTTRSIGGETSDGFPYISNDKENNSFHVSTVLDNFDNIQIGDLVQAIDVNQKFMKSGSKYDCRPMLFSFTDPSSAYGENPLDLAADTFDFGEEPRNLRYFSGRSLLVDPDADSSDWSTTTYANTDALGISLTTIKPPPRVENRMKQSQDFFRALATIIREMKFGQPIDLSDNLVSTIDATAPVNKPFSKLYFTDVDPTSKKTFNRSLVGATVKIVGHTDATKPNSEIRNYGDTNVITGVDGIHTLLFSTGWGETFQGGEKYQIQNNINAQTKYVDVNETGNLGEVFRARIDHSFNTYHTDLQVRLASNKVPAVTVGDGINTIGDYNGDAGLLKALQDVYFKFKGGIIYVKSGDYTLTSTQYISSHTILMGDGHQSNINLAEGAYLQLAGISSSWESFDVGANEVKYLAENIQFKDIKISAAKETGSGIVGRGRVIYSNSPVKNLRLDGVYFRGGSVDTSNDRNPSKSYLMHLERTGETSTDLINSRDIIFENCSFHITGTGIKFDGSTNVRINNCRFFSETTFDHADSTNPSEEVYSGHCSEGLVFGAKSVDISGTAFGTPPSYGDALNGYHTHGSGGISISNCSFSGRQSLSLLYGRGWIFFDAEYTGPGTNITGCTFVGDVFGEFGNVTYPGVRHSRLISGHENAYGIVNYSNTSISVSSCYFHSMLRGIIHTAGTANVKSCNFERCNFGFVTSDGYSDLASAIGSEFNNPPTPVVNDLIEANSFIEGCTFEDFKYKDDGTLTLASGVGIRILDQANKRALDKDRQKNIVSIKSCNFKGLDEAIYGFSGDAGLSSYAKIDVIGCSFDYVGKAFGTGHRGFAKKLAGNTDDRERKWGVSEINYSGNTHTRSPGYGSTSLIAFSAGTVNITNNSISDNSCTADTTELIRIIGGARRVYIDSNSIQDIYGNDHDKTVDSIVVDVGSELQTIKISNNKFSSYPDNTAESIASDEGLALSGVVNFARIQGFYDSNAAKHLYENLTMTPSLEFTNNYINTHNMNYALLAKQDIFTESATSNNSTVSLAATGLGQLSGAVDDDRGADQTFSWRNVKCNNNFIRNTLISISGITNALDYFKLYSNAYSFEYDGRKTGSSQNYLSGPIKGNHTTSSIAKFADFPDDGYVGMIDLRRFSGGEKTSCTIENNDIRVENPNWISKYGSSSYGFPLTSTPEFDDIKIDDIPGDHWEAAASVWPFTMAAKDENPGTTYNVPYVFDTQGEESFPPGYYTQDYDDDGILKREHQDVNMIIGIRCSTFPKHLTIKDNNIYDCQLLVKWTYKSPFEDLKYGDRGGYYMDISGNTITNSGATAFGCMVDINPATGFQPVRSFADFPFYYIYTNPQANHLPGNWFAKEVDSSKANDLNNYVTLKFNDNDIRCLEFQSGCDAGMHPDNPIGPSFGKDGFVKGGMPAWRWLQYWRYYNVVRFWHPTHENHLGLTDGSGNPNWGAWWAPDGDWSQDMDGAEKFGQWTPDGSGGVTGLEINGDLKQNITSCYGLSPITKSYVIAAQHLGPATSGLMYMWNMSGNSLMNTAFYANNNPGRNPQLEVFWEDSGGFEFPGSKFAADGRSGSGSDYQDGHHMDRAFLFGSQSTLDAASLSTSKEEAPGWLPSNLGMITGLSADDHGVSAPFFGFPTQKSVGDVYVPKQDSTNNTGHTDEIGGGHSCNYYEQWGIWNTVLIKLSGNTRFSSGYNCVESAIDSSIPEDGVKYAREPLTEQMGANARLFASSFREGSCGNSAIGNHEGLVTKNPVSVTGSIALTPRRGNYQDETESPVYESDLNVMAMIPSGFINNDYDGPASRSLPPGFDKKTNNS